ncbi:hypothetical protein JTB14_038332 [Gonioctena quinquepunctata]|nr:hypothetical protein JTB14_038332 [Gonioctena quinquepunctata]
MENVSKAVTVHRTPFERLFESMKSLLDPNHDITDLQGNLKVLEQKMEIIMELDRQLLDLMLEDDTPAEDVDAGTSRADEILRKYNILKADVEKSLNFPTLLTWIEIDVESNWR